MQQLHIGVSMNKWPRAASADVLFISEGAYPYISGGVSAWMQTIMTAMPEIKFAVVFLGSRPEDYQGIKYKLPQNLVDFREHYLFATPDNIANKSKKIHNSVMAGLAELHDCFKSTEIKDYQKVLQHITAIFAKEHGISYAQFLQSPDIWEFITERYSTFSTESSFIDYFWTVRNIHAPLWVLADFLHDLPEVKVVHAVSTGYAGFYASIIKDKYNVPVILTEHGIYTKERRIELLQSQIVKEQNILTRVADVDYLRNMWITFFESLANMCYAVSSHIFSLFNGAKYRQNLDGALVAKQRVIVNGIDIAKLRQFRHHIASGAKRICLLGRVVPIKDIKTFIRAVNDLSNNIKDFSVWIVGPTDEDPGYFAECQNLVNTLSLQTIISFKGKLQLSDVLPHIDLMVLSSISEGMPLVILEAFAAGIPVVATNVGACEELIAGAEDERPSLGMAGRVVQIANAQVLAAAMCEMLVAKNWHEASKVAIARVEKYYDLATMISSYRDVYNEFIIRETLNLGADNINKL
jgi:polysaccharide biosynthesis protein PelF